MHAEFIKAVMGAGTVSTMMVGEVNTMEGQRGDVSGNKRGK